jgi:predicted porin
MTTGIKNSKTRTVLAVAALTLLSGAAAAQSSVTIYGNADVGLLLQNNAAPTVASPQLYNGGISPSIWGLRGSEDLGNGLKANFNLESHFAIDTGASTAPLFRRQANVGLASASLGTLTLGTMYSPAVLAFAATDPRGLRENFSGLYPWAYNSGALAGPNTNSDVGVFVHNAISYSNTLGPVNLAVGYSLAEKATGATTGAVLGLGATYSGPVSLSAAYQATDRANTSDRMSTLYSVGAGYTMGALSGKLNYLRGSNNDAAGAETSNVEVIGLGLDWKLASNNTLMAAAYFAKDKNDDSNKTSSFILSDEYALSKRTTLYGTLALVNTDTMVKGGTSGLMTSIVAGGTLADTRATLLNIGVKHSF